MNRSFVLSFKNGDDDPMRDSSDEYYKALVEIKDVNKWIDNKRTFDHPVKSKKKAYEKFIENLLNLSNEANDSKFKTNGKLPIIIQM